MSLLLPKVPSDLHSVAPYVRRAEEVWTADPVIAYWSKHRSHLDSRLQSERTATLRRVLRNSARSKS
jgi:hypothetical protein